MKKIGVVRFLGTNCDQDIFDAIESMEGLSAEWMWYEDKYDVYSFDGAVVPGGFSYGDYLRCGALASKMPVMDSIEELSDQGKPILGICNGFQVLCERGLLPGVLLKNEKLNFIDDWSVLKAERTDSIWALEGKLKMPIAHGEGRYFVPHEALESMRKNGQIWLTYSDNPNGSVEDIAGVLSAGKNVAGLMPHPERAVSQWMGGVDGRKLLERFLV